MAKLKVADFYYGAVLSLLLNKHITPSLIESGNDRQIYDFTTNSIDFRLVVKYRAEKTDIKKDGYSSWTFVLSKDYAIIEKALCENTTILLGLVCGDENLGNSELAVLMADDIAKIRAQNKGSITISRQKNERKYRIAMGGGRENSLQIPCNNLDTILLNGN